MKSLLTSAVLFTAVVSANAAETCSGLYEGCVRGSLSRGQTQGPYYCGKVRDTCMNTGIWGMTVYSNDPHARRVTQVARR
jgi:hypothetical protein